MMMVYIVIKKGYHYEDDWCVEHEPDAPVRVFTDRGLADTYSETRSSQECLPGGYFVVSLPVDEETYLVINKHGKVKKTYNTPGEAQEYVAARKTPSDYSIRKE